MFTRRLSASLSRSANSLRATTLENSSCVVSLFTTPYLNTYRAPRSSRSLHSTPAVAIADRAPHYSTPPGVDPDMAVPRFYVERKRQRDSIEDRMAHESGLMHELSAGILSDDLAATTRTQRHKVPYQHVADGIAFYPSGFVVPTPGEAVESYADRRARDIALQTAAVAERVSEHDDLIDFTWEIRGRDEKVPFEVLAHDGTILHPSGFVPPTPAHAFHGAQSEQPSKHDATFRESTGPAATTPWKQ